MSGAYRSIMDLTADQWQAALGLEDHELPVAVISEGTWWRELRTGERLSLLENVIELPFPDIFLGRWHGKPVAYCCAYGAPRAVEVAHLFGALGADLAIQIGSCGGLQGDLNPGDIVVPDTAVCEEGIAHIYGAGDSIRSTPQWSDTARALLANQGHVVHGGTHLTWYSIFAQDGRMVEDWHQAGYRSVDMETATTLAAATYFDMAAVSMLVVWDELLRGRSFLDPLEPAHQEEFDRSYEAIFSTALQLVDGL
ncbi:MAG: nucleoside phosphorylase [bacterium]|nr:nucleoside phosphorylase [bacterium]